MVKKSFDGVHNKIKKDKYMISIPEKEKNANCRNLTKMDIESIIR